MTFDEIHAKVGHVPFITEQNARILYDLIIKEKATNILELGIAHGTATCYMAAAIEELGGGKITAVDLLSVKDSFKPSAEEQLESTGLSKYAEVVRMHTGYNWFLHNEIVKQTKDDICQEVYDLCIIDGPKNWTIDGAAFFMVDKLLKQDAWIIFDDYHWTYSKADQKRESTDGITHRSLSDEERVTPQITEVFEYLVKQHPNYSNFVVMEKTDWAMAQKAKTDQKTYQVIYRKEQPNPNAHQPKLLPRIYHGIKRRVFK
ncbi:MAG: class I SAM-dependent methyltransferase [Verrucomicrobiota bacterium]